MNRETLDRLNKLREKIDDYTKAIKKLETNGIDNRHSNHDFQFALAFENCVTFDWELRTVFEDEKLTKEFTEILKARIKELEIEFNSIH